MSPGFSRDAKRDETGRHQVAVVAGTHKERDRDTRQGDIAAEGQKKRKPVVWSNADTI